MTEMSKPHLENPVSQSSPPLSSSSSSSSSKSSKSILRFTGVLAVTAVGCGSRLVSPYSRCYRTFCCTHARRFSWSDCAILLVIWCVFSVMSLHQLRISFSLSPSTSSGLCSCSCTSRSNRTSGVEIGVQQKRGVLSWACICT